MTSVYYESYSEISTPANSDYLTEEESDEVETESENEHTSSSRSSSSSGLLTRSETNESIEVINTSRLLDSSVDTLAGLLQRSSLGPKVLNSIQSGEQTENNSGIATPQLFTLEEAKKILAAEKKSAEHASIIGRVNKVLRSNEGKISDDPRGFGFKFLCLCITAAFGGRRGIARYDKWESKYDFISIIPSITDCSNHLRQLNSTMMCYIGHVILYYWDEEPFRRAMISKFGPLDKIIKGKDNIRSEIGAKNLWLPKVREVHSLTKKKIIEEFEGRFEKDPENFEKILLFFGIEM